MNIMKLAHLNAEYGVQHFGGKIADYMVESLKLAHKGINLFLEEMREAKPVFKVWGRSKQSQKRVERIKTRCLQVFAMLAFLLICVSFPTPASAQSELYSVKQAHVTIKHEPSSGLPKALCDLYNVEGKKLRNQIVTVYEQWDNYLVVEVDVPVTVHNKINKIICR